MRSPGTATLAAIAAEARALRVGLAIAGRARWRVERPGPALPLPYGAWLYVATAELLLIPTAGALPFALAGAERDMRAARSDALVVALDPATGPTFAFGEWSSDTCRWTRPLGAWLSTEGDPWLRAAPGHAGYRLSPGRLMRRRLPSVDPEAVQDGSVRAADWLMPLLG